MLDEKVRPVIADIKARAVKDKLLQPKVVYGYFPCLASGDDLIVYHPPAAGETLDLKNAREWVRFNFPRQNFGKGLCISDFFVASDECERRGFDVLPAQIVTMGESATTYAQKLFAANQYTEYLYFHGLAVECAEALAEVMHKRVRAELGFASEDASDPRKFFQQGYRGTRYSFGYPACPNLEDQAQLFELLEPARIDVTLSEEYQLVPEQSTSAIVVVHPEAKYFNVNRKATLV